ncbi:DUF2946 family protein [Candidatus Thiodiazotropha endoloripes]|uniref:DUF2946 family protein n=1 Tax=Candidatus Thiodiazotropha endoloripes TaxID=1818881 RepID=UPI00114D213A
MRTALLTILILNLLISQGIWLDHLYHGHDHDHDHDHDQEEICEICYSAHGHGLSTSPSFPVTLPDWHSISVVRLLSTTCSNHWVNSQLIRAPPYTG